MGDPCWWLMGVLLASLAFDHFAQWRVRHWTAKAEYERGWRDAMQHIDGRNDG